MSGSEPRLSRLAVFSKLMCNELQLQSLRAARAAPVLQSAALACGTVLSRPLSPAWPDEQPEPLRYGYVFESLPLSEEAQAWMRQGPSRACLVSD